MRKPADRYIIGIGAQKAGTSWLSDYMGTLPEVCCSPIKELHFFDALYKPEISGIFEQKFFNGFKRLARELRPEDASERTPRMRMLSALLERVDMSGDIRRYRRFFRRRADGRHIFSEITPAYAVMDEDGFRAMRDLADDVRLVFIMRDPVERLWSALRMHEERLGGKDLASVVPRMLRRPDNALRSNYSRTLETVYKVFQPEQVFVTFYEQLFQEDTIRQFCEFCELDYVQPDFGKMVRQGASVTLPEDAFRATRAALDAEYRWARAQFGERVPARWHP